MIIFPTALLWCLKNSKINNLVYQLHSPQNDLKIRTPEALKPIDSFAVTENQKSIFALWSYIQGIDLWRNKKRNICLIS
jgi:hypothetical protein